MRPWSIVVNMQMQMSYVLLPFLVSACFVARLRSTHVTNTKAKQRQTQAHLGNALAIRSTSIDISISWLTSCGS